MRDHAASGPELPHPDRAGIDLSQVLFALSDPGRRAMVRQLQDGPLEAAACTPAGTDLPKATKSHMLKVLREAGVIRNLPNPQRRGRILTLRRDDLEARFPGLIDAVLSADSPSAGG
ncbi:helix-turn-helix transcriptional regulator [Acidimangrovimonas sediminis]|uniref:helix-turn-helix transcriptional regulator n=1 Tax=Acidimangrovimonas sediminis TaxID=2056283 RepID=UPI000C80790B|nr:helix-turn-helix transcriptional regulator [Acidimangrovimonas sediminis]